MKLCIWMFLLYTKLRRREEEEIGNISCWEEFLKMKNELGNEGIWFVSFMFRGSFLVTRLILLMAYLGI